MNQCIESVTVF